ncbi:WGR domain-containing protein [Pseudooceanicola sp. CBS1P-1]|uniref:WGR domain-containing protein n=1 Tax=Pseudooceanicola albus TaxID=2692189 RepID=A0A6L7G745_9RHOB|nr:MULTISPECIES: WGR domain-containing protein [Pseudooceanicola]MBT9386080.1 WGR domain-containing protein [Pseudooceanicola endophyticus]MXN19502.1 WGR domain-containing protein [Pseudooceanicola albus]
MTPATDSQFDVFPTSLSLLRVEPPRNILRYYRITVQRDLFGGASLVREWGRVGYPGKVMVQCFSDEGRAISELLRLAAVKRRRGYRLDHPG